MYISGKDKGYIDDLKNEILQRMKIDNLVNEETIVTNIRHYHALRNVLQSLESIREGMETGLPSDLLVVDIRQALYSMGSITGEITTDEILGNIFSRFCIGK